MVCVTAFCQKIGKNPEKHFSVRQDFRTRGTKLRFKQTTLYLFSLYLIRTALTFRSATLLTALQHLQPSQGRESSWTTFALHAKTNAELERGLKTCLPVGMIFVKRLATFKLTDNFCRDCLTPKSATNLHEGLNMMTTSHAQ